MILVTAAGGKTGRQMVRALAGTGEEVRALGRSERIHALRGPGVETVAEDLMEAPALRGGSRVSAPSCTSARRCTPWRPPWGRS